MKPYKESTPLSHIIIDGWSRGFNILQTYRECHEMGYEIHLEDVEYCWNKLDEAEKYQMAKPAYSNIMYRAVINEIREEF